METPEQISQIGQYIAWSIALAAVVISPGVNWVMMCFQEKAATRRFNAEKNRRLADEFRKEMAAMLSSLTELSGQMSWMQENGKTIYTNDMEKFRVEMDQITQTSLTTSRIGQSIQLLIDIESEDGEKILRALSKLMKLTRRTANPKFPDENLYTDLASSTSITRALTEAGLVAHAILKKLEEPT